MFKYTYTEGCKEKADSLLNKAIAYSEKTGMFKPDVLLSYKFEHTSDGYTAYEVFASAAGASKYYENFMANPDMAEMMELAPLVN